VIEADIAEEVARVRGYETVPTMLPDTPDAALPAFAARGSVTTSATPSRASGWRRPVTFALVSPQMAERFGPSTTSPSRAKARRVAAWSR
jgi:phenylalanyl-tRNA synthetase beta subunit